MRHWFSPFPLNQTLVALLSEAGLEPWPTEGLEPPEPPCLLIYDRPDQWILAAANRDWALSHQQIAQAYRQLLERAASRRESLLAGWRLERLNATTLQQWLTDGSLPAADAAPNPAVSPLQAAALLGLLEAHPELFNAYSDLELRAELLGDQPDLRYRQWLRQQVLQTDPLTEMVVTLKTPTIVHDLEQQLQSRETELQGTRQQAERDNQQLQSKLHDIEQQLHTREGDLRDAREEAELTLLQLHQVQEELEQIFLADRQKQQDLAQLLTRLQELEQQLQSRDTELQDIRQQAERDNQQLQSKLHDIEQQLHTRDGDLRDAREEAELTLLQLHQLQEELEQLFLADRQKQQDLAQLQPRLLELEQQLQSRDTELQDIRQQAERDNQHLQSKLHDIEQQLHTSEGELRDAREEAELTLLQLHQVQEELEHYFLLSRGQATLLDQHGEQQLRVQQLLGRLITGVQGPAVAQRH